MKSRRLIRLFLGIFFIAVAIFIAVYEQFFEIVPGDGLGLPSLESSVVSSCDPDLEEALLSEEPLHIRTGDTLHHVLKCANITPSQVHSAIQALRPNFNPKDLKPQHELVITTAPSEQRGMRELLTLSIRPNFQEEVLLTQQEDGSYKSEKKKRQIKQEVRVAQGLIESSLYIDAGNQGVPNKILHEMIRILSYQVDFQRNVRSGDGFEVMYEVFVDEETEEAIAGDLVYASLRMKDSPLYLYRYKHKNGDVAFYNESGESIKKAILQTPVDGARITSKFGKRHHPVLGFTRKHEGVDFGVPPGTPVVAAGDGVIEKAGWFGGYGKYIRVRHSGNLKTAYAHLSSFARGIHVGKTVKQGQNIGKSGSTGLASGPHLHFELMKGETKVNPQSIRKIPGTTRLGGQDLKKFKVEKSELDKLYLALLTPPEKEKDGPRLANLQKEKEKQVKAG